MTDTSLPEEVAKLTEIVRELRDREVADMLRKLRAEVEKLRAERAAHQCTCTHIHWQTSPLPGCAPYIQPQIWYGTVTSDTNTFSTTNMAAGCNPAVTTFSISN